jgi:hypothetical protein
LKRLRILGSKSAGERILARRAYDQSRSSPETRRLYSTIRWARIRMAQLSAEPLCRMCAERGGVTPATVCDHATPHRGDADRFWDGPFQSLCAPCHNSDKQRAERR